MLYILNIFVKKMLLLCRFDQLCEMCTIAIQSEALRVCVCACACVCVCVCVGGGGYVCAYACVRANE